MIEIINNHVIHLILIVSLVAIFVAQLCKLISNEQQFKNAKQDCEKKLAKVHKEMELTYELSEYLLPLKADMNKLKANVEGRHAVLKINDWPEQHAFGITKCAGFILDWR